MTVKMKMKISWLPYIALSALIAAVSLADSDLRAVREKVRGALTQGDLPRSARWWAELGPQAGTAVREVFASSDRLQARLKALEAHRFFTDPDSALFLRRAVFDLDNRSLRRTAILSLALSQGIKERSTFETLLASGDPFTRVAAAEGLRAMPEAEAQAMLGDFLGQESVSWVVERLRPPAKTLQNDPGLVRRLPPSGPDPRR